MASKFWSVVIILLVLVSFSKSRAVPEDNLSEIDKDLASILSQAADTSENDADNKIVVNYGKIYKSVLSGFVPEGESTKDTKRAETDKALEEDDMESTFKELLDHLSSQEENSSPMDAADRFGSKCK
ncbi:uncharacterized protein LOC110234710 isoform X1 [Exaiptasia diaphana]|uniref:Uncharacterized protein n=1 Tax=Exaiptasia diaphana TaxID=2652724 RepID=A0A913YGB0_EXADI|nr:uncharacterized protein LOC110234710 isoform X1 [Exaiptasia diaphana]